MSDSARETAAGERVHRPEGWPVTDTPRRVAIIGWATLSNQAREGSGYNLSASELASGLSMSGHEVFYLQSGMRYDARIRPAVTKRETWRGIECYEVRNSPNVSPAYCNFTNPTGEIATPSQAHLVVDWLERVRAEVVHIHSLEGYGFDVIHAVRASGRPVVVTLHNYWMVCSQVDLLHNETTVCHDYEGGKRCETCLETPDPKSVRVKRRIEQTAERVVGYSAAQSMKRTALGTAKRLKNGFSTPRVTVREEDLVKADPEAGRGYEGAETEEHGGCVDFGLRAAANEAPMTPAISADDENERFLRVDHHLTVLNDYGRRRQAGVEALNAASAVIPPSSFLLEVHRAMGLERGHSRRVLLGQPHLDQMNRVARRSAFYDQKPWDPETSPGPLRLAFMGTARPNKGLEVLASAIPLLDRDVRRRCHFSIRAGGYDWAFRKRLSVYPEVSMLGGYHPYQLVSAMGEYHVGLLPHIWFENSPIVLLEHLHAGKFVISSRLGGPVDWIVEPGTDAADGGSGNGLLFRGGDPEDFASAITRLVRGEVSLPTPREVHAVSALQSYPGHVGEVASIYERVLKGEAVGDEAEVVVREVGVEAGVT
ncbi:MAG: glycosyltransferase [Planctomycetota bacterium]